MQEIKSYWPEGETLALWQRFAVELTGKQVGIRLYDEYEDWKKCLAATTGLPPLLSGWACVSVRRGKYTIHLYAPGNTYIEDCFSLFLHELAHIYLNHLGERRSGLLHMDMEADLWAAVNFSHEMMNLHRLMNWHHYGREHESSRRQKVLTAKRKEAVRKEAGEWIFLADEQKAPLAAWFVKIERQLEWQIAAGKRLKRFTDSLNLAVERKWNGAYGEAGLQTAKEEQKSVQG